MKKKKNDKREHSKPSTSENGTSEEKREASQVEDYFQEGRGGRKKPKLVPPKNKKGTLPTKGVFSGGKKGGSLKRKGKVPGKD